MVKIISTISPQTQKLRGIDICRINCAFGTRQEIGNLAKRIKDSWGQKLLLDLPMHRKKLRTNRLSFNELIELAKKIKPHYAALSYVKSHQDMRDFKDKFSGTEIKIVAKIETVEALKDIDRIIAFSDLVMIDRGDLAAAIGIEKLPRAQKRIVNKCNQQGKQVVVATEFLLSMVEKNEPTKSEVVDIANAISDGADFIMLSEETAIGKYSQHSVDVVKKIINELEDKYKVILLSAGPSSGMGALTATCHTCLVDIGKTTILEAQLKAFKECGIQDEDIIIATGKGDALIRDFVYNKLKKPDINLIYNPWHDSSNMLVTFWIVREFLRKGFIVIYGDVIFETQILRRIISNPNGIVLGAEKKICDEEDEKLCVRGDIMNLPKNYNSLPFPKHKCIPRSEAYGEFIGIAKFNRWGAAVLLNEIDQMIRHGNAWAYLMEAFEHLVIRNHKLSIENIKGLLWNDNDTIHDLKLTREKILPAIRNKYKQ